MVGTPHFAGLLADDLGPSTPPASLKRRASRGVHDLRLKTFSDPPSSASGRASNGSRMTSTWGTRVASDQVDATMIRNQAGGVEDAGPQDVGDDLRWERCLPGVSVEVADQALGLPDLGHHLVAHVDAGRTADALVLRSLADIDAGGADLDAQAAIDAIPKPAALGSTPFLGPRLSPRSGS